MQVVILKNPHTDESICSAFNTWQEAQDFIDRIEERTKKATWEYSCAAIVLPDEVESLLDDEIAEMEALTIVDALSSAEPVAIEITKDQMDALLTRVHEIKTDETIARDRIAAATLVGEAL